RRSRNNYFDLRNSDFVGRTYEVTAADQLASGCNAGRGSCRIAGVMSILSEVIDSTRAIIKGMSVTLSYIPKRKQTVEYPEDPVTLQPRYRGQHLLHVDELGREKCVACFLCAAACPSECIYI